LSEKAQFRASVDAFQPERPAIAEVRVRLFGLGPGQSEVQVSISPTGELAAGRGGGPGRAEAWLKMHGAAERELRAAVDKLGSG
jgi:hypothetical protein